MKMFFVLASCLALTFVAYDAQGQGQQGSPAPKKKSTKSVQTSQHGTAPGGHAISGGGSPQQHGFAPTGGPTGVGRPTEVGKPTGAGRPTGVGKPTGVGRAAGAGRPTGVGKPAVAGGAGKPFKPQHFNLPTKSSQAVTGVTFKQGSHIAGSRNWQGSSYTAFRNYTPQWHDANWWRRHHNRIVVIVINNVNSFFFFDAGFWFPAWGYDPNSIYPYDGPIYGYDGLPPEQVVANVQAALQAQGYYQGEIDGVLGPLTRAALADYQSDNGLYITSAVDQPTMESLGFA